MLDVAAWKLQIWTSVLKDENSFVKAEAQNIQDNKYQTLANNQIPSFCCQITRLGLDNWHAKQNK